MAELQQTRGKVRLEGKVVGFNPENERTLRTGTTGSGKDFKSLTIGIKTSETNTIYTDLFAMTRDKVKLFSNKDGNKQNIELPWDERNNMPEGFTCFGFGTAGLALEQDSDGKVKMKNRFAWDAVDDLVEQLEDGMSVWVEAEFNINTYESNGEERSNVNYSLQKIGLKQDIDFEAEGFEEVSAFEQDFVVVFTDVDREAKKLYVTGRLIQFNGDYDDMTFVIDAEKYPTLAKNAKAKLNFGDVVKAKGKCINAAVLEKQESDGGEVDWGGEDPAGVGDFITKKVSEIQITNIKQFTPKVYSESDFVKDGGFEEENNPFNDPFSDDNSDPFA